MKITACIFYLLLTALVQNNGQQARLERLEDSILAPCCYREPVSRHASQIARTIRNDIKRMVIEGKTDRQILDFYRTEYGQVVHVEPKGMDRWVIYGTPALIFSTAFLLVGWILWKWRSRSLPKVPISRRELTAVPESYQKRINQESKEIDC
jgi:cytochrome c-type biogenesis protein CcmH